MNPITLVRYGAAAGVAATLLMDVSNLLWVRFGIRGLEPSLFGKWFDALLAGHLISENLTAAPPSRIPPVVGLFIHYGIGVVLAAAFVLALHRLPAALGNPLFSGIVFGLGTSVFSLLFMFPSMGFGVLGLRPPEGLSLFGGSLLRHLAYGVGLGLVARLWLARRLAAGGSA